MAALIGYDQTSCFAKPPFCSPIDTFHDADTEKEKICEERTENPSPAKKRCVQFNSRYTDEWPCIVASLKLDHLVAMTIGVGRLRLCFEERNVKS